MDIANNSTNPITLTRALNSLHLAAVDAAKDRAAQDAKQRALRASIDQAAAKTVEELQQDSKRDVARTQNQQDDTTKQQSLASLVPPKANLSPSDELHIFAPTSGNQSKSAISADAQKAQSLAVSVNSGHAVNEDGSPVEVEILKPAAEASPETSAQILNLTTRAQAATAALYARNNDAVFEHAPSLSNIAA